MEEKEIYLQKMENGECCQSDAVEGNGEELEVCMPGLGSQYKEWREASHMTLEQASQLSGMDMDLMQKVENGQTTKVADIMNYHDFFMKHIPNARELYHDYVQDMLAKKWLYIR